MELFFEFRNKIGIHTVLLWSRGSPVDKVSGLRTRKTVERTVVELVRNLVAHGDAREGK